MEVILAKSAGFCFGVKRAVDQVYEQIEAAAKAAGADPAPAGQPSAKPIYTYGPIIHNEIVVQDLENRGVRVLESEGALDALTEGTVIIRSHGVPKRIQEKIEKKGLSCIDAGEALLFNLFLNPLRHAVGADDHRPLCKRVQGSF